MIHFYGRSKLDYFKDLREDWQIKNAHELDRINRNMRQYEGSHEIDNGDQADVVRNVTYELIEAQITTDIPLPHVTPEVCNEVNKKCALNIERLLCGVRDKLDFEVMNDIEERLVPIHGASLRTVDWNDRYKTHDTVGRVEVSVLDVSYLTWQPGIYEIQDMDAVFIRTDMTSDDVFLRYGKRVDCDDEALEVFTVWYRDERGLVCKFVYCLDTVLEDVENYWSRKNQICNVCHGRRELCARDDDTRCRCGGRFIEVDEEYEYLTEDIHLSDGRVIPALSPLYENGKPKYEEKTEIYTDSDGREHKKRVRTPVMVQTRLPWYRPDIYPVVIRKNISKNMALLGQSDCEFIRSQQQLINKLETGIAEKQMGSGVSPVKPARSRWVFDKSINKKVLELADGESKGDFGVIDTTVDTSSDRAVSDRTYLQAQRTLGITDTYMGYSDSSAISGYAKQIQLNQASGRLASKKTMKQASYAKCDEAIFKLYLAYADEPRAVSYSDCDGEMSCGWFSRYDFYLWDDRLGEWYINDRFNFSCDKTKDSCLTPSERWSMIAEDYTAGLFGEVGSDEARLAAWTARERAGYPDAHSRVEFYKRKIESEVNAK